MLNSIRLVCILFVFTCPCLCFAEDTIQDRILALDRLDVQARHESWKSLLATNHTELANACALIHKNPGSAWSYRVLMLHLDRPEWFKKIVDDFVDYTRKAVKPISSLTIDALIDVEKYREDIKELSYSSISDLDSKDIGQPSSPSLGIAVMLHLLKEAQRADGDLVRRLRFLRLVSFIPFSEKDLKHPLNYKVWHDIPAHEFTHAQAIRHACLRDSEDLALVIPLALVADDEQSQEALKRLMKKSGFDGLLCGLLAYARLSRPNINHSSPSSFHGEAYDQWLASLTEEQAQMLGRFFQVGFQRIISAVDRRVEIIPAQLFYLSFPAIGPYLASKGKFAPTGLQDYYQQQCKQELSQAIGQLRLESSEEFTSFLFPWQSAPFFSRTDLNRELAILTSIHPSTVPVIEWMKSVALTEEKYPTGAHLSKSYASMPAILLPDKKEK